MTAGSNGSAGGKAQANSPKLDHSVLRSSIDVSITGMKQAVHALENGNKEVSLFQRLCIHVYQGILQFLVNYRYPINH